ncbi:MAG: hypothetical protein ACMUIP_18275, partial [bacterium]
MSTISFLLFSRKGAKDTKKDKKLSELCAFARKMYLLTVPNDKGFNKVIPIKGGNILKILL